MHERYYAPFHISLLRAITALLIVEMVHSYEHHTMIAVSFLQDDLCREFDLLYCFVR